MIGLAVLAIATLLWMMRNATLLFRAEVEQGRVVKLQGRAPKGLVRDLNDVLHRRPVTKATLRVRAEGDRAGLDVTGDLNEGEMQRLRNVLGGWPVAKIRAAPYRKYQRGG
jgi:hypothetical protein